MENKKDKTSTWHDKTGNKSINGLHPHIIGLQTAMDVSRERICLELHPRIMGNMGRIRNWKSGIAGHNSRTFYRENRDV